MSLSEDKKLISVHIQLESKTVDVLWANRILREGVPVSVENVRGAYPLDDNGEPDESVITLMGKSLADVIGDGFAASQKNLVEIQNQLSAKQVELQQYADEVNGLNDLLSSVQAEKEALVSEKIQLQQVVSEQAAKINELSNELAANLAVDGGASAGAE